MSKGVLVSDPSIKEMNEARWEFEWELLQRKRKRELRDLAFILVGDKAQKLDLDKQLEIIPFGYIVNPEAMKAVLDRAEEQKLKDEMEGSFMDDESYEKMLKRYEDSGFDLDDIQLAGDGE